MWKVCVKLSLPAVIAMFLYGLNTICDMIFIGKYVGEVAFRIMNLLMIPIYGLMRALQSAVGINYGAKQYQRVIDFYKVFSFVAFVLALSLCIPSVLFPNKIIHIVMPDVS